MPTLVSLPLWLHRSLPRSMVCRRSPPPCSSRTSAWDRAHHSARPFRGTHPWECCRQYAGRAFHSCPHTPSLSTLRVLCRSRRISASSLTDATSVTASQPTAAARTVAECSVRLYTCNMSCPALRRAGARLVIRLPAPISIILIVSSCYVRIRSRARSPTLEPLRPAVSAQTPYAPLQ